MNAYYVNLGGPMYYVGPRRLGVLGHVARRGVFLLESITGNTSATILELPVEVQMRQYTFVSTVVQPGEVTLFIDGSVARKQATLPMAPTNTSFHPFMSCESKHQINGGCQFRLVDEAYTEAALRRHWRARTVCLTDGEIRLGEMVRRYLR